MFLSTKTTKGDGNEREGGRERDRDRQRDRETQRDTETETQRERQRQRERETDRQTDRQTENCGVCGTSLKIPTLPFLSFSETDRQEGVVKAPPANS